MQRSRDVYRAESASRTCGMRRFSGPNRARCWAWRPGANDQASTPSPCLNPKAKLSGPQIRLPLPRNGIFGARDKGPIWPTRSPRVAAPQFKDRKGPATGPFLAQSLSLPIPASAWWARQDSNLQPDRYERPARPEKTNEIRSLSSRPTTFVRIRSRGFCGHPVVLKC